LWIDRLHSSQITSAANRWTGRNPGGYANPRVDSVLNLLNTTIDATQRIALHRELLREQMGDVALFPLYWEVSPVLMVQGVKGPKVVRNEVTANIFSWDKD
jgi:peptide/nickel transport system substrate-binding protein